MIPKYVHEFKSQVQSVVSLLSPRLTVLQALNGNSFNNQTRMQITPKIGKYVTNNMDDRRYKYMISTGRLLDIK